MVSKRVSNECDSDEPESSKRQLSDLIGRDVTFEELGSFFEPIFRRTVREVVEELLHASSPSQIHDETQRDWMLRFVNQPSPKLFTGNRVEDKDGALLQVEIVDVISKTVVLAGPISSLKLEIIVLPGDFNVDQQKDLGDKYFDLRVVHAREGKKPLIIGEVRTFLKNGVGLISNVSFTDNSRWTKTAKFRLGVRVLPGSCKGYRVREAVSAAFKVKDRRGEACMKHSCPSLMDPIWRLKMIRRNGKYHERLESIGIETVGDFIQKLEAAPSILKETLKCGSSNKTWSTIVEHALSHKKELYEARQVSPKAVYSVNHNFAEGVPRTYPHDFQLQQVADDLEGYTSYNGTHQVSVDVVPTYGSGDLQSEQFTHTGLTLPSLDIRDINPGQQGHGFLPCMHLSSNYHGITLDNQMEECPIQDAALSDLHQSLWTPMSGEEFPHWSVNDLSEMLVQPNHHTPGNHSFQTETPNWHPFCPLLWRQVSASFSTAISEADMRLLASFVPNNPTPRTAWCKLRAAVIWQMRAMRAKKAIPSHAI